MQNLVIMKNKMGHWLIITGIILLIAGIILLYFPGLIKWFGNLPGDINIRKEGTRIFFPVTSLVLISIILTLIVNLIRYLKNL